MAYIGKTPVIGNFVKLDSITAVNGQAAYTMQNGGVNFTSYDNVNQFLVSLNGVLQAPTDSFTVSGSTLTFASNLSTGDVIDFVLVLGNSLDIGTPSDNTISTAKLQDNAITSAKLASGAVPNQSAFKNIIINGDMSIAQRSTSETGQTSSGYICVDRFRHGINNQGTWTISQSTDVPTGQGFANSMKMDCTTADASPAADDYIWFEQRIEGFANLQHLKKGTANAESITVSFWVNATKTGTNVLELYDKDNTRHICQTYTINSSNTWEKKTITFDPDTTGTFNNDNGESASLLFWIGAGSNYTSGALDTTWGSVSGRAAHRAGGQVNHADSTSNNFYLTGIQMEAGTSASDFEFLPFDVTLARCHRYCYVMGASQNAEDQGQFTIGTGMCRSSGSAIFTDIVGSYPQPLRTLPSLTQVGGSLSDVFCYKTNGTSANPTSISVSRNTIALRLGNNMGLSSGLTAGDATVQQINETNTNLIFDAEL